MVHTRLPIKVRLYVTHSASFSDRVRYDRLLFVDILVEMMSGAWSGAAGVCRIGQHHGTSRHSATLALREDVIISSNSPPGPWLSYWRNFAFSSNNPFRIEPEKVLNVDFAGHILVKILGIPPRAPRECNASLIEG